MPGTQTPLFTNLLIDGELVAGQGFVEPILNPATGEVLTQIAEASSEQVEAAILAAHHAFPAWSRTTPQQRSNILLSIANAVEKHADLLARLESLNCGKPLHLARQDDLNATVDVFRFFAGAVRCQTGQLSGEYLPGYTSMVRRDPIGVVASIAPWNYPIMMAAWKIAPALAAGNTVVLKPSEHTPLSILALAPMLAEILPRGVINIICGGGEGVGSHLVSHPKVRMVSLTGDIVTGQKILQAAAKTLKRTHLELGGKAPVIVFDDADIELAVSTIAMTGYFNAGQDCTAATRVIAGPKIYGDFVDALAEQAKKTKTGKPNEDVLYGPLNNEVHLGKVKGFVDRTPKHAKVVAGGSQITGPGYFFEPTVICDLKQNDEMIQNEMFGPVITVQKFSDEQEALKWANGVEFALASSVWTRDLGKAMRMTKNLDFGCVWVNTHIPMVAEMPHGGYKKSGYGKDLSAYALDDYTRIKHVMINLNS